MQTLEALASKPDSEATFFERTAARVLAASITGDGKLSPESHADYAIRAADVLIAKLSARRQS